MASLSNNNEPDETEPVVQAKETTNVAVNEPSGENRRAMSSQYEHEIRLQSCSTGGNEADDAQQETPSPNKRKETDDKSTTPPSKRKKTPPKQGETEEAVSGTMVSSNRRESIEEPVIPTSDSAQGIVNNANIPTSGGIQDHLVDTSQPDRRGGAGMQVHGTEEEEEEEEEDDKKLAAVLHVDRHDIVPARDSVRSGGGTQGLERHDGAVLQGDGANELLHQDAPTSGGIERARRDVEAEVAPPQQLPPRRLDGSTQVQEQLGLDTAPERHDGVVLQGEDANGLLHQDSPTSGRVERARRDMEGALEEAEVAPPQQLPPCIHGSTQVQVQLGVDTSQSGRRVVEAHDGTAVAPPQAPQPNAARREAELARRGVEPLVESAETEVAPPEGPSSNAASLPREDNDDQVNMLELNAQFAEQRQQAKLADRLQYESRMESTEHMTKQAPKKKKQRMPKKNRNKGGGGPKKGEGGNQGGGGKLGGGGRV